MAKAARPPEANQGQQATPEAEQPPELPAVQSLSDIEVLAMDLFKVLITASNFASKTASHVAATAFDHAHVFFQELESRRVPIVSTPEPSTLEQPSDVTNGSVR